MPERVHTMRRSSPHPDDAGDGSPASSSASASASAASLVDESKTKKQSLSSILLTRPTNHLAKLHLSSPCAWPLLLLCLAFLLLVPTLVRLSRNVVCVSDPFDPVSRARFFGFDGLESDFGSLGAPWCRSRHGKTVDWTMKDLIKGLEEFVPIYEQRPIKNNMYGMGFDHSFGLWFMARSLKPDIMIESGAFKGHSTWVLRQAMPDTRIISVTPRHPEKYLKKGPAFVDGNCTYFAGKDFIDFGSMDWKAVMRKHGITDLSRVLIFFDDHQNELKRLKQALKAGFRHMIFEDNYDTGTGDHYSFRQICDQDYIREHLGRCNGAYFQGEGHSCFKDSDEARVRSRRKKFWEKAVAMDELCGPDDAWWGVRGYMRDDFNHSNTRVSYTEHFQNSRFLESVLEVYWELPPVAGPSLTHQSRYDPARTVPPIVEDGRYGLFQRLGLSRLDNAVFNGYTQMVYVQVSEQ